MVFILSCEKEIENFKPTTKFENILKNEKLNKTYWKFRNKNIYLFRELENSESFINFINETNIEELISLTECEKPIIRCFAFKALVEKDYPEIRKILFQHKNDNEIIIEYSRCLKFQQPVKSYMLRQLEPFADTKYRYSKTEYAEIEKDFYNN
jgi:DNA topoisomerase IA